MWKAILDTLPRGYALEEQDWRRRHRLPLNLLTAHIPVLAVIGGLSGRGIVALVWALLVPAGCVLLGHLARHHRRAAAVSVTIGLVWCSASLVALTGGAIEAHFHIFIIIGFIALFQDWVPFLLMIVFTTLSHVLGSYWQRDLIFNHAAGQANPWLWSLVHGLAVLAACVGTVVLWHVTKDVQERNVLARRRADAEAGRRGFTSDLLVNLARRNQSLIYRQLEIINQLEESERDPDTLSGLFTLDHLATRVRRNAESLLVLSGEQPARTWSKPVPMRDVLRAAIAETADLDRVVFVADEQLAIAGHTVTDLTHLIAELTENAVRFSPPDSTVSIRARPHWQQPGSQLLTVEDWGVGMPAPQLAAANALLAKPPEVDLSVSQRLGFHVVARLAARHGIGVSLSATPGSGITATVLLPAALFAADADQTTAASTVLAADTPLTISLPAARLPETEPPAAPEPAPARPDGRWPGWWVADTELAPAGVDPTEPGATAPGTPDRTFGPLVTADLTAGRAGDTPGGTAPNQLVPTPRPRPTLVPAVPPTSTAAPTLPPQADRRAGAQPGSADLLVDPVSGLRRRVPQAHLAPELRKPATEAVARPERTAEAAQALSRYQASRPEARTASENEFGWMS